MLNITSTTGEITTKFTMSTSFDEDTCITTYQFNSTEDIIKTMDAIFKNLTEVLEWDSEDDWDEITDSLDFYLQGLQLIPESSKNQDQISQIKDLIDSWDSEFQEDYINKF